MRLKFTFILGIVLLLVLNARAQQLPQYSLYMFNPYIVNPSFAGLSNELQIRSTNKYQWTGITDAPRTFNLSFTNSAFDENMGYGGWVYTDITGPIRRIGVQTSGNYLAKVSETLRFSIAVSAGIVQYAVDGDKIDLQDIDDPIVSAQLSQNIIFDAKLGFCLHHEKYYFGFSLPHLTQAKLTPFQDGEVIGVLEPHYNVMAGYHYQVNDEFTLKPSFLLKYVEPVPFRMDVNLVVDYKQQFWLGGGYRFNDGIIALAGVDLNNNMQLSYAYDILTSNLSTYSGGVHEIMIGLNFAKP